MRLHFSVLGLASVLAAQPALAQEALHDPWEGANRQLFALHESVDRAAIEPVARGYRAITPAPVREGVRNFLRNLRAPVTFANDVLQGEGERAGVTAARFGVNSTLGLAGLFDPASTMGLPFHEEDFGQTLAVWGVDEGPYVFIPLLGPSTVRDVAGRIADSAVDPLSWADFDDADTARSVRTGATALATRESILDAVESVRRDSIDPYVSIRSTYGLLRESAIQNGRADVQNLPEFEQSPPPSEEEIAPVAPPSSEAPAPEVGAGT